MSRFKNLGIWLGLVLLGLGFVGSFFVHRKTNFSASITAESIQFKTRPFEGDAGLFNSDTPLDLTIEGFEHIQGENHEKIPNPDGQSAPHFCGVELSSVDVSQPLDVSLEMYDGALQMQLQRAPDPNRPMAEFRATRRPNSSSTGCSKPPGEGDSMVYSANGRLRLTLRPTAGKFPKEDSIRLAEGSEVNFTRKSEIGDPARDGAIGTLSMPDRSPTDIHRIVPFELRALKEAILEIQPEIQPATNGNDLAVVVAGSSNDISYAGENQAPTWGGYVFDQKPLQALIVIAAFMTILDLVGKLRKPKQEGGAE
jgi:hypothetical protein